MRGHEDAHTFAASYRERGEPHSGAIDAFGAVLLDGRGLPSGHERWIVAGHLVVVSPEGVGVRCPTDCAGARL